MATETIQATDHKLYVAGEWIETGEWSEVKSPYDGTVIGRVPKGDAALVDKAIGAAHAAFEAGGFPAHERAALLDRAAELVAEREDDLTMTIAAEAGKPVKTARVEAQRCVSTLDFSAVAARTLTGHTVPMEAGAAGEGKLGIVIRVPYGVVGAISPFNFPLNLVAHKLGPAIAAGNAVVLKPAGQTPISARSSSPRSSTTPASRRTGCRSSAARAPRSATRSSRTTALARSPSPVPRRSAGASAPRRLTRR